MQNVLTKEQIREVQDWLNETCPTYGDGEWGAEFIQQVHAGKHKRVPNAKLVRKALNAVLK